MGLAGSHTEKTLWKVVRMRRKRATAVCTLPGKTPHLGRRALGLGSAARARGQLRQWDCIMIRTRLLALAALALSPVALAQRPSPQTPEDAYTSRELIAWSQLQKPQPMPQPLPPRDAPVPQPEQPPDQQAKPPADPQKQQEPAISNTGKTSAPDSSAISVVPKEGNLGNPSHSPD
jgi:hypothetical protein